VAKRKKFAILSTNSETLEKCSILFKFKPPARGAYAPEGKAEILTTPYYLPDPRGRHEYI
jgi:hypothetical protein